MRKIVEEALSGKAPTMGLHSTPHGQVQLAQEVMGSQGKHQVFYYDKLIANSRRQNYNRDTGIRESQ
jgi:hypothetical protein